MYLKTFLLLSLFLLLAIGMGCSSGDTTSSISGGGGDASLYGTWNLVSSTGGFPQRITLNSNGTGTYTYSSGNNTSINWSQSGNTVNITTGSASAATINNLTFPVGNTWVLNSLGGTGTYTRG
jgi:hypothetical protein